MSENTLRERKAVANSAADDTTVNDDAVSSTSTADAALAAAAATATAATAEPSVAAQPIAVARRGPNVIQRVFGVLPFVLLFLSIFCGMSYAQTGTFDYGLSKPLGAQLASRGYTWKALSTRVTRARITVQEFLGLRKPRKPRKAKSKPNAGYGGVSEPQPTGDGSAPPLPPRPKIARKPKKRNGRDLYLTPAQLAKYDGSDPADPTILLSVYGRIFDVTTGPQYYGPQGGYRNLAAKDISRGFANNCFNNPDQHDIRGLDDSQLRSIDHWYEFYLEHETYKPVGWLDVPDIPEDAPLPSDECLPEMMQGNGADAGAAPAGADAPVPQYDEAKAAAAMAAAAEEDAAAAAAATAAAAAGAQA